MWLSVATILALGAAASPVSLEAAAGFEAVASKLAGQPSKLPDVVKSRLKLVKLHCAVLTNRPQSWAVRTCTRVTCLLRTERSCEAQGSSPRGERGWGACATRTAFHTDVPHTTGTAALTNRAFTRLPLRRWTLRSGVRARRGPFRSAHTQYRCPTADTAHCAAH